MITSPTNIDYVRQSYGNPAYGLPSQLNVSTTALSANDSFVGSAEKNPAPQVMVSVKSDVAGTLYFEFSNDGTNWDVYPTNGFSIAAGVYEIHVANKGPRRFRIRYVNGTSNQSYFRLYCYYGSFPQLTAPLNQAVSLDSDSVLTRTMPTWLDIARGLVNNMDSIKKFGRNTAVGTSYVPLSLGGIYRTPQSGSATALRVKAGNTNDTANGSGARSITLEGLDENFNLVTETIATAGTSASSATTATFTRLFRAYVATSGTYATQDAGSHSANIVIEDSAGSEDWATIDASSFPKGQSEIAAYTVPAGHTAYVFLDDVALDSGKTVDLVFFQRTSADDTSAPYKAMRAVAVLNGLTQGAETLSGRIAPLGPFVGPCDIGFMGKVDAGTGTISAEFEIYLVKET